MAVTIAAGLVLVLLFVAGPAFFARRNLRMGRGDRGGAARLMVFVVVLYGVAWLFSEHHLASLGELLLFVYSAAYWLLIAGWLWLMYIALEPYARRRWPRILVGWSRLLAGDYRDPLVGRDLLVGCLVAAVFLLLNALFVLIYGALGAPQLRPDEAAIGLLSGFHLIAGQFLRILANTIFIGLALAFLVSMMRVLLRNTWAAAIVPVLLLSSLSLLAGPWSGAVQIGLLLASLFLVFLRFGLLAAVACTFTIGVLNNFPITTHSGIGLTGPALLLAFALYAFHASLGGQPLFGRASLED
jgi:serine/threonine-protein kinase